MENKIKTTGEAETKEEDGNFIYIVLSLQLCPTLCDPWTVTHQAPVHEIFQPRNVALSFPEIFLSQTLKPHLLCLLH